MMTTIRLISLFLAACAGQAVADATLTYQLTGPGGATTTKTLAIARFFARIDDSANSDSYLLYQAGKFFPLYEVKPADEVYTRLTPEVKPTLQAGVRVAPAAEENPGRPDAGEPDPAAEAPTGGPIADAAEETAGMAERTVDGPSPGSESETVAPARPVQEDQPAEGEKAGESAKRPAEPLPPKPELRASREKRELGGIACRVVDEIRDGKPVLQHCMANKASLGVTEREIRTLSRTFVMARERDLGWLGAATGDEEFVSIQTRDPATGAQLVLQTVSTAPLPQGHLKIPREFKLTNP